MDFIFPYIGDFIIPIDFHIFQMGWNHQSDKKWGVTFKYLFSENNGSIRFFLVGPALSLHGWFNQLSIFWENIDGIWWDKIKKQGDFWYCLGMRDQIYSRHIKSGTLWDQFWLSIKSINFGVDVFGAEKKWTHHGRTIMSMFFSLKPQFSVLQ